MTLFKNAKRKLSLLFVLMLVVNMISSNLLGNSNSVKAAGVSEDFWLTSVVMKKGETVIPWDQPIELAENERFSLILSWEIANDAPLADGDKKTIQVPDVFLPVARTSGAMVMNKGKDEVVVGAYIIDGNNNLLTLTYNDVLKTDGDNGADRSGEVIIDFKIDVTKFTDDASKLIDFGYEALRIPIVVKNPNTKGNLITKSETHETENPSYVDWTVDVNTKLNIIQDAIVSDQIPVGLSLITDSIKVEKLKVSYDGTVTGISEDVTASVKAATGSAITMNDFTLGLGEIKEAYRITYRTNITEYGRPGYTNHAIIKNGTKELGNDSEVISSLTRGALIEKSGVPIYYDGTNSKRIQWTININKAEMNLSNVLIEDTPISNQTLDNSTIKVWELNKYGGTWHRGSDVTNAIKDLNGIDVSDDLTFPIQFGDLNKKAYELTFEADINYPSDYTPELTCTNEAKITANDGITQTVSKSVDVTRGALLTKETTGETVNYDTKQISWRIVANQGKHTITNATLHDNLPEGLTLKRDSIKIKVGGVDKDLSEFTVLPASGDIVGNTTDLDFSINFGTINDVVIIEYITKINDQKYYGGKFDNEAWLTGGGIGTGSGPGSNYNETIKKDITPAINNGFYKNRLYSTETIKGVTYDGLNYETKTMSWKLDIKPIKEEITKLEIIDTFPNKGQFFLKDSLRFVDSNGTLLIEGTDYTITDLNNQNTDYQKGFKLILNNGVTLKDKDYYIYYKTSFDKDKYPTIEPNPSIVHSGSAVYNNTTEFKYNTSSPVTSTAQYEVDYITHNEGDKKSTKHSLQDREIQWEILANHQGRLIKNELVVDDKFSAGQVLDEDSIRVIQYKVKSNGATEDVKTLSKGTEYTVTKDSDELGFILKIIGDTNSPYRIEYKTKIIGLSKQEYTNTATIEGIPYSAKITNPTYDKFLSKTADSFFNAKRNI